MRGQHFTKHMYTLHNCTSYYYSIICAFWWLYMMCLWTSMGVTVYVVAFYMVKAGIQCVSAGKVQCVSAGVNGQKVFSSSRGLVEAGEVRMLKVKRTASLALCQDCRRPRVLLSATSRPLPHTDFTVIHLTAHVERFKWTQILLNSPSAGCLEGNCHVLVADLTVWLDLFRVRREIKDG